MKDQRIATAVMVAVIAVGLVAPSTAFAAGALGRGAGNGAGKGVGRGAGADVGRKGGQGAARSAEVGSQDARLERLLQRIERMLVSRQAKFDRVEARLKKRIERLILIADAAAAKGIDVSAAKATLVKARDQLAIAAAEEVKAQEFFMAVADAADKRVAFAAARTQAKTAQKSLQRARLEIVSALRILRAAVDAAGTTTP